MKYIIRVIPSSVQKNPRYDQSRRGPRTFYVAGQTLPDGRIQMSPIHTLGGGGEPEFLYETEDPKIKCETCGKETPLSETKFVEVEEDDTFGTGWLEQVHCPHCNNFIDCDIIHECPTREALLEMERRNS